MRIRVEVERNGITKVAEITVHEPEPGVVSPAWTAREWIAKWLTENGLHVEAIKASK